MNKARMFSWLHLCLGVCLFLFNITTPRQAGAQLSGPFHSAPGTLATYEYHANGFQVVLLPVDITMNLSGDNPTSMLTATIHKPIISVAEDGTPIYPIGVAFPMVVTGTSSNGRDFYGNLLDTQYLFHWQLEPAAHGELLWNGQVGWAGGRYEETTITAARLIPGLPGDYNLDGTVDAADYVVWRKTNGSQTDYNVWRSHFGHPPGSGSGTTVRAAVPEPATLVLLMLAVAGIRLRRRNCA